MKSHHVFVGASGYIYGCLRAVEGVSIVTEQQLWANVYGITGLKPCVLQAINTSC